MRAFFVVSLQPGVGDPPHLVQVLEQVGIQHLGAVGLVEAFVYAFWFGLPGWM